MKKYLVIFEAPCVGVSEELVSFKSDKLVSDWAWEKSVDTREYIPGGYEIYEIVYNRETHLYELELVNEIAIWEADAQ